MPRHSFDLGLQDERFDRGLIGCLFLSVFHNVACRSPLGEVQLCFYGILFPTTTIAYFRYEIKPPLMRTVRLVA
jgi:hypothetical protein